jgi:hypothetical protein
MKEEIQEIKAENQEMKTKMEQLMQFMHKVEDLEIFSEHSNERVKNE